MVQNKGYMENIQRWEGLFFIYFCVNESDRLIY